MLHALRLSQRLHTTSHLLRGERLLPWLAPRLPSITHLSLDLTAGHCHSLGAHHLEELLALLAQQLTSLHLAGAVGHPEGHEALGLLRQLEELEVVGSGQSLLDSGLFAICYLPRLTRLSLSLDIFPACPAELAELPRRLARLELGGLWLEALPEQLRQLQGLTSICLHRCHIEADPLPLMGSLPRLATLELHALPSEAPSLQLAGLAPAHALRSLVLRDARVQRLPASFSVLTRLTELDLSHNPELGQQQSPGSCLPHTLSALSDLAVLSLAHCGLPLLPPPVSALSALVRLSLQGNPITALPAAPPVPAFAASLESVDLSKTRLRDIPSLLLCCRRLHTLHVSAGALAAADLAALPVALPALSLLQVEGALWEQRAVKQLLALVQALGARRAQSGSGSSGGGGGGVRAASLQVELV